MAMWIKIDGGIINLDRMDGVAVVNEGGAKVIAYCGDEHYPLKRYSCVKDAEAALDEIYKHLEKGDNAMRMPVWNW